LRNFVWCIGIWSLSVTSSDVRWTLINTTMHFLRLPLVDTDQQLAVLGQRDHTTLVSVS